MEYVFELPGSSKLKATGGKRILVDAFKGYLPRMIHRRPKWGFEMPIGAWLRQELKFLIDDYLDVNRIKAQDIFHHDMIQGLVRDHMTGRRDTSWQIWNLIVFQHWYASYMA